MSSQKHPALSVIAPPAVGQERLPRNTAPAVGAGVTENIFEIGGHTKKERWDAKASQRSFFNKPYTLCPFRNDAHLLQQTEHIEIEPGFGHAAALKAEDNDPRDSHCLA
jgi:hypothetical protein